MADPNFTQPGEIGSSQTEGDTSGTGPRLIDGRWWSPESGWITKDQADLEFKQNGERVERGAGPERVVNPYEDAARFGKMADPRFTTGPQIDMVRPDESRGLSMDALGMLRRRADGGEVSPAQQMQAQQTAGAVSGIQSGAASIKGGAMARAAAARGAQATGAKVAAQGAQDGAALRAREMADASSQYFGASSAQRTRDLGVANSQAELEAKQREANEQRDKFYKGLEFDQKKSTVDDQLGRTAADSAAENSSRNAALNESNAEFGRTNQVVSGGLGAINGGVSAYNASQNNGAPKGDDDDPWNPHKYSGSDPKTKKAIKPISDAEAKRLKGKAADIGAQTKAMASAFFGGGKEYDGKYGDSPFPEAKKEAPAKAAPNFKDVLDDRFGEGGESRGDPYKTPPPPTGVTGAPKGYAASRNGQMGSMFGSTMRPEYDLGSGYSDDPDKNYQSHSQVRPENQWAPGSSDLYAGSHVRDLATSDPAAKRAAFIEGVNHASDAADTGKFGDVPDYMKNDEAGFRNASVVKGQPPKETKRAASSGGARDAGAKEEQARYNAYAEQRDAASKQDIATGALLGPLGAGFAGAGANSLREGDAINESRKLGPRAGEVPMAPPPAEEPGAWSNLVAKARDYMPSDERTKDYVVPLRDESDGRGEQHYDADVSKAKVDVTSGASLSGPSPKYSSAPAEKPKASMGAAATKQRKLSNEELKRLGEQMLGAQRVQNDARLADGPAIDASKPVGAIVKGNIDHMGRPEVDNHDGTTSTVRSMSFNDGPGREVLIPTAYDGAVHSEDDSIANYRKTGQHMGVFRTPDAATAHAEDVHNDYEDGKYKLENRPPPEWLDREMMSDPKTKNVDDKFGGPMADANRSMAPSSYEYKPEFLPPEQKPGETNVGPMADKMKADPVAGTAIVKDPRTGMLAIDKTKALKLTMGGLASLQRQVDTLQSRRT